MLVNEMQVKLIDKMGNDNSVVNAARISFDKAAENYSDEKNEKLIKYLATHNHWTPFGHTALTFHIKAPIFVARQLGKHQVGLVWNEVSRRYVDDEPEFYLPSIWRARAENVKQGSSETETIKPSLKKGVCVNCGSTFSVSSNSQKYCSVKCQGEQYRKIHPEETKWNRWKSSAKARGFEFSIDKQDVEWVERCPYLGIELNYNSDGRADNVASLDRIDSSKGYIKGNVQIISSLANKMKNDATDDELVSFARSVLLRHSGVIVPEKSGVEQAYEASLNVYNTLLEQGVCPEQARMFLPQGVFTEWYWTGSLAAFSRVCKLRLDSHTQKETRDIAEKINKECAEAFPISWKYL